MKTKSRQINPSQKTDSLHITINLLGNFLVMNSQTWNILKNLKWLVQVKNRLWAQNFNYKFFSFNQQTSLM